MRYAHAAMPAVAKPASEHHASRRTSVVMTSSIDDVRRAAICQAAIDRLASAGTDVDVVDEVWAADPVGPWITMWVASRARTQGHLLGTPEFDRISESLKGQIEWGMGLSAADMARAIDAVHELNLQLDTAFERAPLLLTPVCAGHMPHIDPDGTVRDGVVNGEETQGWVGFTYGFNMTRNPAGTVNVGFTGDGMPVALQVVGRQRDDLAVLQAISAMEELFGVDEVAPI